jgi:hypothetical protein
MAPRSAAGYPPLPTLAADGEAREVVAHAFVNRQPGASVTEGWPHEQADAWVRAAIEGVLR